MAGGVAAMAGEVGVRLFHYSARHHFSGGVGHAGPGIYHVGIIPNRHPAIHMGPIVWLTSDPSWSQEWSPRVMPATGCDRTEVRVSVVIPKHHRHNLFSYREWASVTDPDILRDLVAFGVPETWFVYAGSIPVGWLRKAESRPVEDAA